MTINSPLMGLQHISLLFLESSALSQKDFQAMCNDFLKIRKFKISRRNNDFSITKLIPCQWGTKAGDLMFKWFINLTFFYYKIIPKYKIIHVTVGTDNCHKRT